MSERSPVLEFFRIVGGIVIAVAMAPIIAEVMAHVRYAMTEAEMKEAREEMWPDRGY